MGFSYVLTKGEIRKKVLDLSGPALAEIFLATLIHMVDMIMVGRVGPEALTAVGLSNQLVAFTLAIFVALNIGTTAVVARSIGGGNPRLANDVARQSLVINFSLGLIVSALGYYFSGDLLRLMGASEEVLTGGGLLYAKVVFGGTIFMNISMGLMAGLRGAGDTRTPMNINIIANIVNLCGNYVLIYGKFGFPRLGVYGAGISTTISRAVASLLVLYVVYHGSKVLKFSLKDNYLPDVKLMEQIIDLGLPAALEQLVFKSGMLSFARVVSSLGTTVFAAHQIAMNVLSLLFIPSQAFSIAATTLVGQRLGAGEPKVAEECGVETQRLGVIISSAIAVACFFLGPRIIGLYTPDKDVIALGAMALKIVAIVQPAQATQFILAGALRGAGDTKWPLYASVFGIWGGRVFLGYLFTQVLHFGLLGAWVAIAIDQCIRAIVIFQRFSAGRWKALQRGVCLYL